MLVGSLFPGSESGGCPNLCKRRYIVSDKWRRAILAVEGSVKASATKRIAGPYEVELSIHVHTDHAPNCPAYHIAFSESPTGKASTISSRP